MRVSELRHSEKEVGCLKNCFRRAKKGGGGGYLLHLQLLLQLSRAMRALRDDAFCRCIVDVVSRNRITFPIGINEGGWVKDRMLCHCDPSLRPGHAPGRQRCVLLTASFFVRLQSTLMRSVWGPCPMVVQTQGASAIRETVDLRPSLI